MASFCLFFHHITSSLLVVFTPKTMFERQKNGENFHFLLFTHFDRVEHSLIHVESKLIKKTSRFYPVIHTNRHYKIVFMVIHVVNVCMCGDSQLFVVASIKLQLDSVSFCIWIDPFRLEWNALMRNVSNLSVFLFFVYLGQICLGFRFGRCVFFFLCVSWIRLDSDLL